MSVCPASKNTSQKVCFKLSNSPTVQDECCRISGVDPTQMYPWGPNFRPQPFVLGPAPSESQPKANRYSQDSTFTAQMFQNCFIRPSRLVEEHYRGTKSRIGWRKSGKTGAIKEGQWGDLCRAGWNLDIWAVVSGDCMVKSYNSVVKSVVYE